jgi:hypothetical protein
MINQWEPRHVARLESANAQIVVVFFDLEIVRVMISVQLVGLPSDSFGAIHIAHHVHFQARFYLGNVEAAPSLLFPQ